MTTSATNVNDYDAITRVVEQYIAGAKSGKGKDMKPAFHADATIFGYVGADLFAGPIQQLFTWNDENGPATEFQARIASIDVIDTVATVRLELVLPYSVHLAVDALVGIVFLVEPIALGFTGIDALYYWANGAAVLIVVGLHKPAPASFQTATAA